MKRSDWDLMRERVEEKQARLDQIVLLVGEPRRRAEAETERAIKVLGGTVVRIDRRVPDLSAKSGVQSLNDFGGLAAIAAIVAFAEP